LKSRGFMVGTIKITSHELQFDSPGKDTDRHRKSGAAVTLIKSRRQFAAFTDSDYLDNAICDNIFAKCHLVLIEGDNTLGRQCIYVADSNTVREDLKNKIKAIWGSQIKIGGIPNFSLHEIDNLSDFIINDFNTQLAKEAL